MRRRAQPLGCDLGRAMTAGAELHPNVWNKLHQLDDSWERTEDLEAGWGSKGRQQIPDGGQAGWQC